ncbi:MAG TPA: hypothetical protein VGQ94_03805 [Terriglobales bacterium]|nr:hypothetical protein [Terriglobales bacterium]
MKLEELIPRADVAARYGTRVQASLEQTREALRGADFSQMPLTRVLMGLRKLGWSRRKAAQAGSQEERLRAAGFIRIPTGSEDEVLLGVVGRFWRLDSGTLGGLTTEEIIAFERDGYAKAMWNFTLERESDSVTRLATETRVVVYGSAARRKFRAYWLLVGPFSGLIRREMLRLVRRRAEAAG